MMMSYEKCIKNIAMNLMAIRREDFGDVVGFHDVNVKRLAAQFNKNEQEIVSAIQKISKISIDAFR